MTSYLTVNEIEELAESLVRKFHGKRHDIPESVDIDSFVLDFLNLPILYRSFAEADTSKIGFISDGITPLWIYQGGARAVVFPKGTIVLEKALTQPREETRRRFTLAHEAGHDVVDRTVATASFHREYDNEQVYTPQEFRELLSFRESQVDRLAAALLMPRYMVLNNVERFTAGKPISIYGNNLLRLEDKLLVQKMADIMGVSYTAFLIRLKQLGLYSKRSAEEYITLEMGLGNEAIPL